MQYRQQCHFDVICWCITRYNGVMWQHNERKSFSISPRCSLISHFLINTIDSIRNYAQSTQSNRDSLTVGCVIGLTMGKISPGRMMHKWTLKLIVTIRTTHDVTCMRNGDGKWNLDSELNCSKFSLQKQNSMTAIVLTFNLLNLRAKCRERIHTARQYLKFSLSATSMRLTNCRAIGSLAWFPIGIFTQ